MDEIRIWKIAEGLQPQAVPLDATDQTKTEKLLEDVLAASPELLMNGLTVLGRQLETPGGPLDILGVSEDGKLIVFELKRGVVTRDAVAQVFDYASYLADLSAETLYKLISNRFTPPAGDVGGFQNWYEARFQGVEIAGKPKCVLVGLGVDERAKRMVKFLSESGVDISLLSFYGFRNGEDTLLARQVEVAARDEAQIVRTGKAANLAKLQSLLDAAGVRAAYNRAVQQVKAGLGESAYAYPFPPGFSFSLPGTAASGAQTLLAYVALYISENRPGFARVYLQPRTVTSLTEEVLHAFAEKMNSKLTVTPAKFGELWINLRNEESLPVLLELSEAIRRGWLQQRTAEDTDGASTQS